MEQKHLAGIHTRLYARFMPHFSIRDLMFATALVALGIFMVSTLFKYPPGRDAYAFVLWFGGGAMIGAGLFTPFGRVWWGAVVGFAAQIVVVLLLVAVVLL
jgi:hypothetical protein